MVDMMPELSVSGKKTFQEGDAQSQIWRERGPIAQSQISKCNLSR